MIPMPPSHCISACHIITACDSGGASAARTVAPVVVKPDMASKKASDASI